MSNWTKFSDKLPEEGQEQVWVQLRGETSPVISARTPSSDTWESWLQGMHECAIAWHPITCPELPREETIWERDEAAFKHWDTAQGIMFRYHGPATWHAALAYERAEVAKELDRTVSITNQSVIITGEAYRRLRKRVGLDK